MKMNIDRLKDLEEIAEKLGIGQNREVECVGCKKIIRLRKEVILTDKKKVTYLCKDCYQKLEEGELDKKQINKDDILKEIEKYRKQVPDLLPKIYPDPNVHPVPYKPEPIPWVKEPTRWDPYSQPPTTGGPYYLISSIKENKIFKLES